MLKDSKKDLLVDLKKALVLKGSNFTSYANNLRNPKGEPVGRTNIYHAIKYGTPKWLYDEIQSIIAQSKADKKDWWSNQ